MKNIDPIKFVLFEDLHVNYRIKRKVIFPMGRLHNSQYDYQLNNNYYNLKFLKLIEGQIHTFSVCRCLII